MENLKKILTFIGEKNPKYKIEKHFNSIENRDDNMNYHGKNIHVIFNNMEIVADFHHGDVVSETIKLNGVEFEYK